MKMTKAEKIIVVILIVGVIIAAGIFLLIMPAYQKIEPADKRIESLRTELNELNTRLARLDTIDGEIEENRKSAEELEKYFYPELTTYETNEIVMQYLKDCGLETHSIAIGDLNTTDLELESYIPGDLVYPLRTYSDVAAGEDEDALEGNQFRDGNDVYTIDTVGLSGIGIFKVTDEGLQEVEKKDYTAEMKKQYVWALCEYAESEDISRTVAAVSVSFNVTGTYEDYLKFLDYINALDRAAMLNGVGIPMSYELTQEVSVSTGTGGASVSTETVSRGFEAYANDSELEEISINLTLYCIKPMEDLESIEAGEATVELKEYANR